MPFGTVKLIPGVNTTATPSLNAAGITESNLIRFRDGIPEKMAGWSKYYGFAYSPAPSALHAWQGLDAVGRLGVGQRGGGLNVLSGSTNRVITPQYIDHDPAPNFSTTIDTDIVTVVDTSSSVTGVDIVEILTPVAVGGLILVGRYRVYETVSANSYKIQATSNATATVANGGSVPSFQTFASSVVVRVTITAHGLAASATFSVREPMTVGGLTFSGLYTVQSIIDANTFTIHAPFVASSNATSSMNSGNVSIRYWIGVFPSVTYSGFGRGTYGSGYYGTGVAAPTRTGTAVTATDWTVDNYGGQLVACAKDAGIFVWDAVSSLLSAVALPGSPEKSRGIVVSPMSQQIIAYGSSVLGQRDPMVVNWCDVADYWTWTATARNQAGSFRLPEGAEIRAAMASAMTILLWTDQAVWSMQYTGDPSTVFSFNKIAQGAGIIAQKAAGRLGASVYWMGDSQFYVSRAGAQPIPCPVRDEVFPLLDRDYADRVFAAVNSWANEVTWFYPTVGSAGITDRYVKYNVVDNTWDYGTLDRTAWVDASALGAPIGASSSGFLYEHESGNNDDTSAMAPSFRTGWFTLAEGQQYVFIDEILPDIKFSGSGGSVTIKVLAANEPGATPIERSYTVTDARKLFSTRLRARLLALEVSSSDMGSAWRLGAIRFRFAPDGRR